MVSLQAGVVKRVTHSWGDLFRDLVAAVLADALDEDEYESLAYLMDQDMEKVEQWVCKPWIGLTYSFTGHLSFCWRSLLEEF